jgi:hypothetical protein
MIIISYLILFVGITAALYAICNANILLDCLELISEAVKSGNLPPIEQLEKSEKVLAQLIYLAATLIILYALLKITTHA